MTMSTKRLLVIGAGFLQKFVIQKAKKLGYCVLAVDGNSKAEGFSFADESKTIDIVDQDACLSYAKSKSIDGVMTAATDYGVLTASYIAEKIGLAGLNYSSAKLVKNKYMVKQCFYQNDVDDSEFAYEINENTDFCALSRTLIYPVMIKPCDGSGSRGANRVDGPAMLESACRIAINQSISRKAVVESFIEGTEYGVESFVEHGNIHILAIMKKWMTSSPYYAELGHAIPSGLSADIEQNIKDSVKKAILALGINFGAVNMDLLITKEGEVHIVDVGARMGGNLIGSHIVPIGTGVDYLGNLIQASVGDPVDLSIVRQPQKVATRLLALKPGKISSIPQINVIEREYNVQVYHHMKVGDIISPYRTNLDGMGYVLATGTTVQEASHKAEQVKQLIDKCIIRE